jgi:predicted GNAT family N-acyltransferase
MKVNCKAVVAATPDAIAKVFALRAAVFMSEQDCPYDEEFDGNDFCATHILGLVDDVPGAVIRVRYFAGFAKIERLAVLPRYRRTLIAKVVVEAGIELCRRKGYRYLYGHAQKRLTHFWGRFGFKPLHKNVSLVFSDHEYVELAAELEPHADPITMMSDPYVILRPEGDWDEPGVLDRSANRPATNPH